MKYKKNVLKDLEINISSLTMITEATYPEEFTKVINEFKFDENSNSTCRGAHFLGYEPNKLLYVILNFVMSSTSINNLNSSQNTKNYKNTTYILFFSLSKL